MSEDQLRQGGHYDDVEQAAAAIARRGRDALLLRLRPAFREAAAAHADLLELSEEQIEEMVQRAADEADGLQWRRALAAVATEELALSLTEALGHPAVARAQELLGVPSYEESLAALSALAQAPQPPPGREDATAEGMREVEPEQAPRGEVEEAGSQAREATITEPATERVAAAAETDGVQAEEPPDAADSDSPELEGEFGEQPAAPEAMAGGFDSEQPTQVVQPWEREAAGWDLPAHQPPPGELEDRAPEREAGADEEAVMLEDEEIDELRIAAIHLGGIANLSPDEPEVELRLAAPGLDIIRANGEVLGRLDWEQIDVLEVPEVRRRLRRSAPTQLVIRTPRGNASFEVPGVEVDELREHLEPIVALYLTPAPE